MKKLFENFRHFVSEGELTKTQKARQKKLKVKKSLTSKEKKELEAIQHK